MASLVEKFFEEDLNRAEATRLELGLEASDEMVDKFIELAEKAYKATGLPQPRWDKRAAPKKVKSNRSSSWFVMLLLVGAFWAGYRMYVYQSADPAPSTWMNHQVQKSGPGFATVIPQRVYHDVEVSSAVAPAPAASSASLPEPPLILKKAKAAVHTDKKGDTIGVNIKQDQRGPATVRVMDPSGVAVRLLFKGPLDAGDWRFEWDGKSDFGMLLPAGDYRVEVTSGGEVHRLRVDLE